MSMKYWIQFSSYWDIKDFLSTNDNIYLTPIIEKVKKELNDAILEERTKINEQINNYREKLLVTRNLKQNNVVHWYDSLSNRYYQVLEIYLDTMINKAKRRLEDKINNLHSDCENQISQITHDFITSKKWISTNIRLYEVWLKGEYKTLQILKNLPWSYIIINDFHIILSETLYHYKTRSYIKSIQIDHIVIGPNGIFCLETKNWHWISEEYYNPFEQNDRHSYALYKILERCFQKQKYPVKNIIVSNNVLNNTLDKIWKWIDYNNLFHYIINYKSQKIQLSYAEVDRIWKYLLEIQELWEGRLG